MDSLKIKKKFRTPILLLVLLAFSISGAYAISDSDYFARSVSTFDVYFPEDMSILFQINQLDEPTSDYVALQPITGALNGSSGQLWLANQGGKFSFYANETCVLQLTENIGAVRVNGVGYGDGSSVPINAGTTYTFEWSYSLDPIIPISLLLGIVGVAMIFGGSLGTIHYGREREMKPVITCVIIALVGFALFVGWFF